MVTNQRFVFPHLLVFVILVFSPMSLFSQETARSLSGTITAPSGSGIPNALITVENLTTHQIVSVHGDKDGSFFTPRLSPGRYAVIASAPGFAAAHATVALSSEQPANLVLHLATSSAPGKGQNGSARDVVNSTVLSDLPLNGRSASDVATLESGVATARTQTSGEAQRGFGAQMTISGSRPRQNDSRLDGISVNDYANGPPGSALGVNLGVDAVEQFSVLSSNYPAQYGRSSGGIVSASTRSGTSVFHGDVYEFLRNSVLDARNYFDKAKPPFRRNQFGVSMGGPIRKDRTFIFGDYEGRANH
jgi:hypothetical protein